MSKHLLSLAGIGMVTVAVGFFAFASNAFAAASIESLKLTGPNTLTVVYSQPVYTSPSDYTNFTGSFSGESVTSVTGSGTNTIQLTLSGSVASTATGYVSVGTNVQDVSDQEYFPGSTWNIVDAIGPAFTSFSMSSSESNGSFAGTNDTISVSFDTNESVNIIQFTIDGHPISVNGGGTGPFTGSYTLESGDSQQSIPVNVTIADNSNNQTSASFVYTSGEITSGGTVTSVSGAPVISSITSNANTPGILTNGNSITFTLTPVNAESGGHVTGSYNGVPLNWVTTNGGVNYVATYVVAAGQSNQPVPLQISGVTLTDQYGNVSAPASGYDIQQTISVTGAATTNTTTDTTTATTDTSSNATITTELQALQSQLAALETQEAGGSTSASTATATDNDGNGAVGTMPAQHTFTEFLSVGSEDAEVEALQEWLTYYGFYTGPITGYYGTLTQTGVENFQSAHNIDVYGYVGPATRAALNAGE